MIKDLLTQLLDRRGYTVIPHWRLGNWPFSQHLKQLFAQCDIDCVLDVGANLGQYRDFLRNEVGYQHQIISFEPVQKNVLALQERAKADPAWTIVPMALGRSDTEAVLNVTAQTVYSSFLTPDFNSFSDLKGQDAVDHTETVRVRRLDTIFNEISGGRKFRGIYLKIDTQGTELDVLEGAGAQIASVSALQMEVSLAPLYKETKSYYDVIETARGLGFEVTGLYAVGRDRSLRVVDVDCVLRNMRTGASK